MKNLTVSNNANQNQTNTDTIVKEKVADKTIFNEKEDEVGVDDTMYKILMMNNDNTSEIAVREVLSNVYGYDRELSTQIMMDAHVNGSAIVWIDTQEKCHTKLRETMTFCGQLNGETIEGCNTGMEDGQGDRPHYYGDLEFILEEHEEE